MRLKINYLLLIILAWIFLAGTCDKDCKDSLGRYEFVLPVTVTPAIDTFHIGDTIYVSSEFSNSVYERVSDKEYLLDSFRFYPLTRIIKIDTTKGVDALNYFEFIIPEEYEYDRLNAVDNTQYYVGEYSFSLEEGYSLEYKMVLLSEGVFFLRHSSDLSSIDGLQDFPGRCKLEGSYGICEVNEHEDNNFYLLEDSPDPHFSEWVLEKPEKRFYDLGGYVFVVVE